MANESYHQNGTSKTKKPAKKVHGNDKHYATEYVDMDENSAPAGSAFVTRVIRIPIVSDGFNRVSSYVKAAPYGEIMLGKSVDTFNKVQKLAQPYYAPLDVMAVKALDSLEQRVPIISQPTSVIIDTVTAPPLQVYADVRKTVEVRVAEPAAQTATAIAKGANQHAAKIVDHVEYVVERFLPADNIQKTAGSAEGETNQVVRLYDITTSLPTRFSTLVNAQLEQHHIPHTTEDFIKLKNTSALLRETTARIEILNAQLTHWVEVSRTTLVAGFDSTVTTVTANERVQQYTQELLCTLEKTTDYVKQHGPTLPDFIQVRLNPLITFVNNQYQLVSVELKKDALPSQKAKNVLVLTQQQVLPLMKKSLEDVAEQIRAYQQQYLQESERVLDGFKTSLRGLGVPVK